jgi:2'-5' RNA ligase
VKHADPPSGKQPPVAERPVDPFVRREAFLGFPLSTTVATGLAEVMRRVDAHGGEDEALRWVAPPLLHVSFRHLGPMFPEHLTYLAEQLGLSLAATERFPVHLGEFVLWPDADHARALWVRLADDDGALVGLRRTLDETLAALDLSAPEHRFEPHVTLALTRGLRDPQELLERATAARGGAVGRFWVTHVQVFAAPAAGGGEGPYEPWARVALQPRAGRDGGGDGGGAAAAGDEAGEESPGSRVVVRYMQPLLPSPAVEGGGRPVMPGGPRLRRILDEGDSEQDAPEFDDLPDADGGADAGAPPAPPPDGGAESTPSAPAGPPAATPDETAPPAPGPQPADHEPPGGGSGSRTE